MTGLTPDQIAEILGKSRGRNVYGPKLIEFMESDEAAINVAETWPIEFGEKSATAMYQSFRKAAENAKVADQLSIRMLDGAVYLLHTEKVALALNLDTPDEIEADEDLATSEV